MLKIKFLTKSILYALFTVFISCQTESITQFDEEQKLSIQQNFTLENFEDSWVRENLLIDWENTSIKEEEDVQCIEYITTLKAKKIVSRGKSSFEIFYRLLVTQAKENQFEYRILEFLPNEFFESRNNVGYYSLSKFSGTIFHYDLTGKLSRIEGVDRGIIKEAITDSFLEKRAPSDGCGGGFVSVKTERWKDWGGIRNGKWEYSYSTPKSISYQNIWVPSHCDPDYITPIRHEHGIEDGSHIPNISDLGEIMAEIHADEVLVKPPSCKSFNYIQSLYNSQTAAIRNLSFRVRYRDPYGQYHNVDVVFNQPLYFTIPRFHDTYGNMTTGDGKERSARSIGNAGSRAAAYFLATDASESQVRSKLLEYLRDEFRNGSDMSGGSVGYEPPLGSLNIPVTNYIVSTWFEDDCN